MTHLFLLALAAVLASPQVSAVMKCTDASGRVTFSDRPCATDSERQVEIELRSQLPGESRSEPDSEGMSRPAQLTATGFVIHSDGYLMTNSRVIEFASRLRADFSNGETYDAEVVFHDYFKDIAVLKIQPSQPLPVLTPKSDTQIAIRDQLLVLGYTTAALPGSEPSGSVRHVVAVHNRETMGPRRRFPRLEIDTQLDPGSAGGPILDRFGNVVGIVVTESERRAGEPIGPNASETASALRIKNAEVFLSHVLGSVRPTQSTGTGDDINALFESAKRSVVLIRAEFVTRRGAGADAVYTVDDLGGTWATGSNGRAAVVPLDGRRCLITGIVGASTLGEELVYELRGTQLVALGSPSGYPKHTMAWTLHEGRELEQTEGPGRLLTLTRKYARRAPSRPPPTGAPDSIESLAGDWITTRVSGASVSAEIVYLGDRRYLIRGVVGGFVRGKETVYELRGDRLVGLTQPAGYTLDIAWKVRSDRDIIQVEGPFRGNTLTRIRR